MPSFEFNKIFAAILVAGIIAMLSGFIAEVLIHPHQLEKDAVPIEGSEVSARGIVKETGPEPILHLIATADIAQGQKLSKACAACHSFEKGGSAMVGPNLWNVVGSDKASNSGFAYSDALQALEGNWSYLDLNKFLWKPKKYAPGTKMNYIGLKKPEDRAAIAAWLRTLADSPKALPSDAQIEAEKAELAPEDEEDLPEGESGDGEDVHTEAEGEKAEAH